MYVCVCICAHAYVHVCMHVRVYVYKNAKPQVTLKNQTTPHKDTSFTVLVYTKSFTRTELPALCIKSTALKMEIERFLLAHRNCSL